VIRDEMEQTRAHLAEKLGALETQVRETVSGATEAVSSTVEGVKDVVSSVSETVESVTETFNVSKQVEQHPWMAFGAAVATGFVIAQVVSRATAPSHNGYHAVTPPADLPLQTVTPPSPAPRAEAPPQPHPESGLMHSLESMLPDMKGVVNTMAGTLGGLAVGGLMGVIREMASQHLPPAWQSDATRLIDQVTTQLGGKPLDSAHSQSLLGLLGLDGHSQTGQGQTGQGQTGQGSPTSSGFTAYGAGR